MVLGLRGGNRFSKRTLVGTLRNARDAPIPDLPTPVAERGGSTRSTRGRAGQLGPSCPVAILSLRCDRLVQVYLEKTE
jgi:hypothetical protein